MSTNVAERLELIREILTGIAAREGYRLDACPARVRSSPQDRREAEKAVVAMSHAIAQGLAIYRKMTPAFVDWSDVELSAALSMVGDIFSNRMHFRSSSDFEGVVSSPGQVVDLLVSYRSGRLREYACLSWSSSRWDIEWTQPDALVALVLGD